MEHSLLNKVPDASSGGTACSDVFAKFCDIKPRLSHDKAQIEASRCYFCYDAPCVAACPTGIDIPGFIRGIATNNLDGAAERILSANILGGSCARVCPTEILCEGACVRTAQQAKPVEIGALQRVATDHAMAKVAAGAPHPFARAAATGRRVAIIGAGPAGLACAHRLAMLGHEVVIFEARSKPGGLNEYGIAAYKMVDRFAACEVEFILAIGGIEIRYDQALGRDITLAYLREAFDAVFLAIGQTALPCLALPGEHLQGVEDAVAFIERIRQAEDLREVAVGRNVVVIGGGNTAIDAATQAKRLGAEVVTIVYRRGREAMKATVEEQDWALGNGVALRLWSSPVRFEGETRVTGATFALAEGEAAGVFTLPADMVLKAVGQRLDSEDAGSLPALAGGRILVDPVSFETTLAGVFAGGDCIASQDLTVQAVADGKSAATGIHAFLQQRS
ncbi:NAD(P)-dependent oxidoreductase [Acidiphilium sp. PM]|uniref:NAD(P)-dependent oxidoreductase n=1 Tax=Acidiphilium sp. PM TaxID=1043206 RepID=UPI001F5269C7|nr:NAD(P)-dependent oxidoreductase [Acidiphilium sp. PM]